MQYRKCPGCHRKIPIAEDFCSQCNIDLSFEPPQEEQEKRMYLKCPVCGFLNILQSREQKIRFCQKCKQDNIRKLGEDDICFDQTSIKENESFKTIEHIQPEQASKGQADKKETGIILHNKNDEKMIHIPCGTYMLGAFGDIEQDYFNQLQYVSGKHLIIEITDQDIYVMDNNSRNKSRINGSEIVPQKKMKLVQGDILKLADQEFEVEVCK